MSDDVVALTPRTWPLFADLVERQGGLFGSCWCTHFHVDKSPGRQCEPGGGREFKQRMVEEGVAHAALVVREGRVVAWAEYGTPEELPNLHHRKQYVATEPEDRPPATWRVTCIQVDKTLRRQGLAEDALRGAVRLIGESGGGVVEGYPHDMALKEGRKTSSSWLYNGTRRMYERVGFTYDRPKGQFNCVMRLEVPASGG